MFAFILVEKGALCNVANHGKPLQGETKIRGLSLCILADKQGLGQHPAGQILHFIDAQIETVVVPGDQQRQYSAYGESVGVFLFLGILDEKRVGKGLAVMLEQQGLHGQSGAQPVGGEGVRRGSQDFQNCRTRRI